jgi:hypothetical protein
MRFGTWNVRSLYRGGSLKTVVSKSAEHNLVLVAVLEVTWDESGSQLAKNYVCFCGNENANHHLGVGLFGT